MAKKILVIRFSSIGDIVLTTPVIRALKQQLNAEVHFLTKESYAPIVQYNPYITRIITLSEDFNQMMDGLRKEHYDFIVDLHHNLRTSRIKWALQRPSASFYKLNFEKWLLVQFHVNRLPGKHIVDRYMEAAAELGIKKDREGLDFFIPEDKRVNIQQKFGCKAGEYVAIVTGAAHQTKCLTTEQLAAICDKLDRSVILLGGKGEWDKAEKIITFSKNKSVKNACSQLDILESGSVLQQAGSIISHDTGMMHIAAALRKPQVVIWGNTVPEFGMYPYYGDEPVRWISFERELSCRPCTKLGFEKCPKGHFKCMLDHNLDELTAAAISLIKN